MVRAQLDDHRAMNAGGPHFHDTGKVLAKDFQRMSLQD
jgi:hypothetical protein